MPGDMQPAWVIIVTVLRRAEVVPPYGWTLPCTIQPAWVGIVTWAAGDS